MTTGSSTPAGLAPLAFWHRYGDTVWNGQFRILLQTMIEPRNLRPRPEVIGPPAAMPPSPHPPAARRTAAESHYPVRASELQFLRLERVEARSDNGCLNTHVEMVLDDSLCNTGAIRLNDADRQILFGLVAIRLKLVTLAQVSRALADWMTNGELSLARLLIERRQLDEELASQSRPSSIM